MQALRQIEIERDTREFRTPSSCYEKSHSPADQKTFLNWAYLFIDGVIGSGAGAGKTVGSIASSCKQVSEALDAFLRRISFT